MRRGVLAAVLWAAVASASQTESPARTLETTISRASQYVAIFVSQFSHVVSEEHYDQEWRPSSGRVSRRQWVADFLLVRTDETAGWTSFRDVFEVDRKEVHDQSERLTTLLQSPSDDAQSKAVAITEEASRYNIGPKRTVNNPLLAMALLQDLYRPRFQFSMEGHERVEGRNATILGYLETSRPTIIRSADGGIVARGRYWVDDLNGSILKTELIAEDAIQQAKIVVEFQYDDRFHLWTPLEMRENYTVRRIGMASATAKYGRFRGFQVTTTEQRR